MAKIKVIEGNKKDSVSIREIDVNGKYIRGFGVPNYAPGQANLMVEQAEMWLGKNEKDGSFKEIVDVYNSKAPVKAAYSTPWCAEFVGAVAIKVGADNVIPLTASCGDMISKFKKMGEWDENDARVPNPGDIIFYDWDDNGKGDDTTGHDHVGIVKSVDGVEQPKPTLKSTDEIAKEVIAGKWGNGDTRKKKLTEAGYDYKTIQNRVNEMLKQGTSSSAPASSSSDTYTVVKGDTLTKIGAKLHKDWKEIAKKNGIKSPYIIRIGQKLKV